MKRFILLLCIFFPMISVAAVPGGGISKSKLKSLISDCRKYEGAEVNQMGRVEIGLLKASLRFASKEDIEAKEFMNVFKGIHGMSILDFEDCSAQDKETIRRKLHKLLSKGDIIMEVNDEGEKTSIYGTTKDGSDTVKDIILYTDSGCALVCFFGTVPMNAVAKLANYE